MSKLLEGQIRVLCGDGGGASVTFEELHRLTDIELDVVAVDLKRQHPVVFNYHLTPGIEVTSAVVASAAIPLAFEWMPLRLRKPPLGIIVDGGVMSNYPAFVFKDPSFRRWAGLPAHPPHVPVVGFLLDEVAAETRRSDLYREAAFLPPFSQWGSLVNALLTNGDKPLPNDFEPKRRRFRPQRHEPRAGAKLAWALARPLRLALWPVWKALFDWMPAFLLWNAGGNRGNWPEPKNPLFRSLVGWFDALMAGTRPWGVFVAGSLAVSLCLGVGAYSVAWRPLAHHISDIVAGNVSIVGGALELVFWVLCSLVPIYAWTIIETVFLLGWLVHRTLQVTGYGLVKTFLQSPGAPAWVGADSNDRVVRLPVPPEITTLEVTKDRDKDRGRARECQRGHAD